MIRVLLLCALALTTLGAVAWAVLPSDDKPVSRHEAKVRTFRALLHVTELAPDSADATKAAITVRQCRRVGSGWLCHGELAPVSFSGIGGSVCPEIVVVHAHSTDVRESQCH